MKLALRLILFALGIGLCVWMWIHFHPTPQEAIRRRLVSLAKAASFEKPQGNIAAAVNAEEFSEFFGREVALNMEPRILFPDSLERSEISKMGFRMRSEFSSLDVKLLDPIITVGADNKSAIVELTINAGTPTDSHLLVQEVKFTMKEVDGNWLIIRVETIRTLNQLKSPSTPLTLRTA